MRTLALPLSAIAFLAFVASPVLAFDVAAALTRITPLLSELVKGNWVSVVPVCPELRVVILRQHRELDLRRVCRVAHQRVAVVAHERAPGLLPLFEAPGVGEGVAEIIRDGGELLVERGSGEFVAREKTF